MKLYFHTNIPAPYRQHQFELLAKSFDSVFYIQNKCMDADRTWAHNVSGWNADIRFVSCKDLIRDLISQPWGSVHFLGGGTPQNYERLLVLSALFGHSKIFLWNDAGFPEKVSDAVRKQWRARARIFYWLKMKTVSGVLTPGALGRQYSLAQGCRPDQIVNAYFSHDIEKFDKYRNEHYAESRRKIRKQLDIAEGDVCCLNISRYLDLKRLVDLANALLAVESAHPDLSKTAHLILIGDGECKDHLPVLSQLKYIRVHLIKPMPPDDVLPYYCASDLFVFPSEGDIWGLVVNEALSMGLPVVCTDRIGAAELVHNGENGYTIPVRRPDLIAEKMVMIMSDGNLRKSLSKNALALKEHWRTSFGIEELKKYIAKQSGKRG